MRKHCYCGCYCCCIVVGTAENVDVAVVIGSVRYFSIKRCFSQANLKIATVVISTVVALAGIVLITSAISLTYDTATYF